MADDDDLISSLGPLPAARDALDLVAMASGLGDVDLVGYDNVDERLTDLIVALTKLSRVLLVAAVGRQSDVTAGKRRLLDRIRLDQELRAARSELDEFDGWGDW